MDKIETPFPATGAGRKRTLAARLLMKSVVYSFALFGLLFIVLLVFVLGMLRQETGVVADVPDKAILFVDFNESYPEMRSDDLFSEFSDVPALSFYDLTKAINLAALDPKVKALIGNISLSGLGLAQIEDLRSSIRVFRSTGKRLICIRRDLEVSGKGPENIIWPRRLTKSGCSRTPRSELPASA